MSAQSTDQDPRVNQALDHLRSILIDGESLDAWAVQRRLFALRHRRVLIAATTGRFIALTRGPFGGFKMVDLRWQDVSDVKLQVGVFGADLSLSSSGVSDLATARSAPQCLSFRGLRKEQCQQVYRLAQFHEQAWREKRRVRELEEMRAKSGGMQLAGAGAPQASLSDAPRTGDAAARLKEAKQMLDAKLITDSEYETIKARIISGV